jgi:adenosylcobinamide-phosphate synthase
MRDVDCCRLAALFEGWFVFAGLSLFMVTALLMLGVLLDLIFGEARRWHPLVGFGCYAAWLEGKLNRPPHRFAMGAIAWLAAVIPGVLFFIGLIAWSQGHSLFLGIGLHAGLLYFCLGLRSLRDHTLPIARALLSGDVVMARQLTARIVSRDTQHSKAPELAKAAVESLLENGNDAVFGTLFWFIVAGGPGALLFRLANTLDAMWGYRSVRFQAFGCVAARIDDGVNWIPARMTALSYTLLGNRRAAWRCWRTQARRWSSPNAGPVMSAGAGALGLKLGGVASYDGVTELRPPLGTGDVPCASDIARAWRLVGSATALWCGAMFAFNMLVIAMNGWKG